MYAKIQSSMWDGTLGGTGEVWAVFVFLLAKCDAEGYVDIHPKVIAGLTGFDEGRVVGALRALEAPDPASRSREMEGSRLERLDEHREWGWRIVNYVKYRNITTSETMREQNRRRVTAHRDKKRITSLQTITCNDVMVPVMVCNGVKRQAEAEAEAEALQTEHLSAAADVSVTIAPRRAKRSTPRQDPLDAEWEETFHEVWWPDWLALGRECSKAAALESWRKVPHPEGQTDYDRLQAAFERAKAGWVEKRTEPRFIPHASTWLNDYHKNLLIGA